MNIVELGESEKKDYNRFVAGQETGSFLQSWEWGEWQVKLGHAVKRFSITDQDGRHVGVAQFLKMSLVGKYYYWYAPYGPVLSPEFRKDNIQALVQELQKQFPDTLFVRIEPMKPFENLSTFANKTTNIQPAITMVVDVRKSDEQLLAGMHSKTRYNIKVAERHGVEIQKELVVTPGYGLYVQEAVNLIVQTQTRQGYRGHSKEYYYNLIDFFAIHNGNSDLKIHIYKALCKKQLLASGLMIDFGATRMYLYGGSSDEHRNVMAPYLLHYQAMRDARELGLTMYDLGGSEVASGGERGFTRFKQGFGGRVVTYAGAYDIVHQQLWYTIYTLARSLNRLFKKIF